MFAKKPPPDPTPPSLPPVLHFGEPMEPPKLVQLAAPLLALPVADDALAEGLERISEPAPPDRIAVVIIAQALREGASEITLTPNDTVSAVLYLVAGEWRETMSIPIQISPGLVSAFKTLAGLPIWEHRMALQGLIPVECPSGSFDVHLTIAPTRYGEKITMRIEIAH